MFSLIALWLKYLPATFEECLRTIYDISSPLNQSLYSCSSASRLFSWVPLLLIILCSDQIRVRLGRLVVSLAFLSVVYLYHWWSSTTKKIVLLSSWHRCRFEVLAILSRASNFLHNSFLSSLFDSLFGIAYHSFQSSYVLHSSGEQRSCFVKVFAHFQMFLVTFRFFVLWWGFLVQSSSSVAWHICLESQSILSVKPCTDVQ